MIFAMLFLTQQETHKWQPLVAFLAVYITGSKVRLNVTHDFKFNEFAIK